MPMRTIIFATAIFAVLLLADTLVGARNSEALRQRLEGRLAAMGLGMSDVKCEFRNGWPSSLGSPDGYCILKVQPDDVRDTLGRFGERQMDARVGGPWGKRTDAAGDCWRALTVRENPPSLACSGSEENVRECPQALFFQASEGRFCIPLSSFDAAPASPR